MFTARLSEALSSQDNLSTQKRGGTFAAAFRYTPESRSAPAQQDQQSAHHQIVDDDLESNGIDRRRAPRPAGMNGYTATPDPPPPLYVRALYNYEADDQTSLSFRQGDIIQVLTQLDSGWWDGVINDVRGWFPSNYCAVVSGPDDPGELGPNGHDESDTSADSGADDESYDEQEDDLDSEGNPGDEDSEDLPIEGAGSQAQEEAAFWIPQATPDGRLFYFNTLTGASRMELPLEAPTSAHEAGPVDRTTFFVPEQSRPPPEMMARGLENEEEYDGSASEAEGESLMMSSQESLPGRKTSAVSDSFPAAGSGNTSNIASTARNNLRKVHEQSRKAIRPNNMMAPNGVSSTSFAAVPTRPRATSNGPRYFVDDGTTNPVTWASLVDNMRQAVEAYREAINNNGRSEFVRKAEDISDHLRMLLAAGSGTTDNHSGNPSIISTNKALYPHFRDMMSRFSKLVLSSHIAAADWPGPDALAKCLQEAEGVLHGVYGYVEVARQQRGDELPRLVPGFISGSKTGGYWRNNNLPNPQATRGGASSMDEDSNNSFGALLDLDTNSLYRIDDARKRLLTEVRRLEDQLTLRDKLITPSRQAVLGDIICAVAGMVIESFRPWIALVEALNLGPLGSTFQNPQLMDFSSQKQKAYDDLAGIAASCQAVTAPLADEWAESRGQSLEDRLNNVRVACKEFDNIVSQMSYSLQLLLDTTTNSTGTTSTRDHRMTDGGEVYQQAHLDPGRRPILADIGQSQSFTLGGGPQQDKFGRPRNLDKAQQFFGQMPPPNMTPGSPPAVDETPWFLQLDHLAEVTYDPKFDPPQLKSGTLHGLVEQLTRHDRLDPSFNATFLLTYKSFTTADELFEMLVRRFSIQPPARLTGEEYPTWEEKKQKLVRLRVVNIIKTWFETYWMENNDERSQILLERAFGFAKNTIANTKTPGAKPLMATIDARLKGQDTSAKRLVLTLTNSAPPPIIPKNMKKLKFLDIDATEFARQLTIIESKLYGKIKPTECLDKTWQRKVAEDGQDFAPNVKSLILHSNQLTNWVAEMILSQPEVKKRVIVIKHFVAIADKCGMLNNYSTLTSVVSALGTAPIMRLNRTWNQVPQKTKDMLDKMRVLMASTKNFSHYREKLHLANPPCIPFLGMSHIPSLPTIVLTPPRRLPDRSHFHRRRHCVSRQE